MRRLLPFIFPLIAFLIVVFLLIRWFNLRAPRAGQINLNDLKTQVEELLPDSRSDMNSPRPASSDSSGLSSASDLPSISLEPLADATGSAQAAQGTVRYMTEDSQVKLQVFADLAPLSTGWYQVWTQSSGSAQPQRVAQLSSQKGGYVASFNLPLASLPTEIVISEESKNDAQLERILLKGRLEKP